MISKNCFMLRILFWLCFLFLAIEDNFYQEVNLYIFIIFLGLFAIKFSFITILIGLILYMLFYKSKYIGEADLFLIPIGLFLSNFNIYYFVFVSLFGLFFMKLYNKSSAMFFPIFFTCIFLINS